MHRASKLAGEKYGRKLDFGLRVHMVVRETEKEAQAYALGLLSKLDQKQA